jgi:hypothetical protein
VSSRVDQNKRTSGRAARHGPPSEATVAQTHVHLHTQHTQSIPIRTPKFSFIASTPRHRNTQPDRLKFESLFPSIDLTTYLDGGVAAAVLQLLQGLLPKRRSSPVARRSLLMEDAATNSGGAETTSGGGDVAARCG